MCCAAAIGGDNLQDLKCGQLVGSTPWKQQVMQILGVVVAAFAMAPILNLLNDAYTIGSAGLPAPQANLMGTVAKGVFAGGLPWTIIGIGAGDRRGRDRHRLDARARAGSKFRIPVMAFAVGVYLPFDLNVPIFLGGVIALLVNRAPRPAEGRRPSAAARSSGWACSPPPDSSPARRCMGIGLAVPVAVKHNENALALFNGDYADFTAARRDPRHRLLALLYKLALKPEPKGENTYTVASRTRVHESL